MSNYGEENCGKNCNKCEWYGTCPHSYGQFDDEEATPKKSFEEREFDKWMEEQRRERNE